jgi:hypothetical protein
LYQRSEEARIRAEKLKNIKTERKRVRELYVTAKNWKRSQALREYIAAVRERRDGDNPADEAFAAWLAWAAEQADRLDPFCENPPSILDEDVSELEEAPSRRLHLW